MNERHKYNCMPVEFIYLFVIRHSVIFVQRYLNEKKIKLNEDLLVNLLNELQSSGFITESNRYQFSMDSWEHDVTSHVTRTAQQGDCSCSASPVMNVTAQTTLHGFAGDSLWTCRMGGLDSNSTTNPCNVV
jgi:hypothetical protein